jgi:hypothetical protein
MTKSNGKPITAAEAHIVTATVSVQVIRIGKRQLTLSVFRQLPVKHILDGFGDVGDLAGEPWGTVNYHWDSCGYSRHDGPHVHVVWAQDGRLYRDCVGRVGVDKCRWGGLWLRGDPLGLDTLGDKDWDEQEGGHYIAVAMDKLETLRPGIVLWNQAVANLAALPQLFIAT